MEKGFLCQQVFGFDDENKMDWKLLLADDFQNVKFSKSFMHCMMISYFRNYIWLMDLIFIVWFYIPTKFIYYTNGIIALIQHLFYFRLNIDIPDL
jgi:uncharacterized membrane protein